MRKKYSILIISIFVLATIFLIGGSYLVQRAKQKAAIEKISIEEVTRLLSVTTDATREEFLQQCRMTLDETGYLPKEQVMTELVAFVQERQPELEMGEHTLLAVTGDPKEQSQGKTAILAQQEGQSTLSYYEVKTGERDTYIVPGDRLEVFGTKDTILLIRDKSEAVVMLEAVWIKSNTDGRLTVKYGDDEFEIAGQDTDYRGYEDIADLTIANGGVLDVKVYSDKIHAKLISVKDAEIELEGDRIYPYVKGIQVYKLFGEYEPYTLSDLKIGYDFTDFVLNDEGQIVAALVTREGWLDKIRVVVKTTDFASAYHEVVTLSCDTDMTWQSGGQTGSMTGGEEIILSENSEMFETNRIVFTPAALSARTTISSIQRSQGTPAYRGTIEVERTDDGLLVINELPLDEYLYSVVPSEMPASYPLEALKAQAVSARTYAYAHMADSRLQSYGAHVDDSAAFQVYNNIMENDMTTRAVRETEGTIVCQNGETVTTYFYSTSCGYGTDLSAWVTSEEAYLKAGKIGEGEALELAGEDVFRDYITKTDASCYEAEETYFRWKYETVVNEEILLENLQKRYAANPDQILTKTSDGYVAKDIRQFGKLKEILVEKRAPGGAITELVLVGSEATIKILSEKNVRYVLANESTLLMRGENYSKEGTANGMLPSAFLVVDVVRETDSENSQEHDTEADSEDSQEHDKKADSEGDIKSYIVWGGGFGHGIGMSQNGARQMAERGMDYSQILQFFYVGTELENRKKEEE